MKLKFNHLTHGLVLSSCLMAANITSASANGFMGEKQIAMYLSNVAVASYPTVSKLSAQRMLDLADNIASPKPSRAQQKLEFALIYSAANKGHAEAQFRLAYYYMDSDLIIPDEQMASFWLEQAIEQGHQGAQFVYNNIKEDNFDIGC